MGIGVEAVVALEGEFVGALEGECVGTFEGECVGTFVLCGAVGGSGIDLVGNIVV